MITDEKPTSEDLSDEGPSLKAFGEVPLYVCSTSVHLLADERAAADCGLEDQSIDEEKAVFPTLPIPCAN
jgi:hypothetical protein